MKSTTYALVETLILLRGLVSIYSHIVYQDNIILWGFCGFNLNCKVPMKLEKQIKQDLSDLKHNHGQEKSYL